MVVRMCKEVLATPRSWYACLAAEIVFLTKCLGRQVNFSDPSPYACHRRTVLRFPTNSYHFSPTPFYSLVKEGAFKT